VQIFFEQGPGEGFLQMRTSALFAEKKTSQFFEVDGVFARTRGAEPVRTIRRGSQFFAILCRRPLWTAPYYYYRSMIANDTTTLIAQTWKQHRESIRSERRISEEVVHVLLRFCTIRQTRLLLKHISRLFYSIFIHSFVWKRHGGANFGRIGTGLRVAVFKFSG